MLCQLRYLVAIFFLSLMIFGGVVELSCGAAGVYVAGCRQPEAALQCCCDKTAGVCKCNPEPVSTAFLGIPQLDASCCTGGHGATNPGAELPPSATWKFLPPTAMPTIRFELERYAYSRLSPSRVSLRGDSPPVPPPKGWELKAPACAIVLG